MDFLGIKQHLENIDYGWTKPQTCVVLIPVLSLLIQKIQFANILPLIKKVTPQNVTEANMKSKKFENICQWHLKGSMIQILAAVIDINIFATPLFLLVAIPAAYQIIDLLIKSIKSHPVDLYEFHSNGQFKTEKTYLPLTS